MQIVKDLLEKGETKRALKRLLTLVTEKHEQDVILLLANFNAHERDVIEGTQEKDTRLIARTNKAIIAICDKYESSTKPKIFAEPPILDNLPLDKDGYLLGRKVALEELHTALQGQGILTLVNGMGGIGKSTLAAFYANFPKYRAVYEHCFWVAVSDITGEIEEAIIAAFAEALALYKMTPKQQLQKIETYLLGLQGQTLLILDNANDDKKVKNSLTFLRKCKCKVLFTTRANVQHLKLLPLAKLLPEDAFTLFTHYFPAAKEMPETPQLLQNIDYHTLLTEFMAKSLQHSPTLSLQDLIAITQQQNFTDELLAYTKFTTYHTHTHSTPDTEIQPAKYLLQIFPIQNLSEQEQQILRYFSILPTEWIGIDTLKQLFVEQPLKLENNNKGLLGKMYNYIIKETKSSEFNKNIKPSIFNTILAFLYNKNWLPKRLKLMYQVFFLNTKQGKLQLGTNLQSLYEKGWLQKSPTNAFACHILLQHLLRQQLQPNTENCELLLENLYVAIALDSYTNKLTLAPYLPLIATILDWIKKDTQLIANIYNNSADIYRAIGNYFQALNYDLENVRIKEKILSTDNINLASSYNNIAVSYEKLGNYQKALEYAFKNISICEKVLSLEHPSLATAYAVVAFIYEPLGNYQKALEYGLKALTIYKKVLSPEHPSLAISYNNIASTYKKLGDYQKSLEYGLSALAIKEKVLSPEHPNLATSYNNIAIVYYHIADYATAYTYIQKAVTIRTKVLPKGHPHIQNSLDIKTDIEKAMRKK